MMENASLISSEKAPTQTELSQKNETAPNEFNQ